MSAQPDTPTPVRAERLLAGARRGDPEAFERLLEEFRNYLLLIANRELDSDVRRAAGASDLVQETMLRARANFGQFRGASGAELRAWLRRILLNHLSDVTARHQGAQGREGVREVPLAEVPPAELVRTRLVDERSPESELAGPSGRDRLADLRRAVARLPEDYRRTILWRNYDRLSFEEIGRRMGRSAEAARKLWVRALRQLKGLLEPGDGP